MLYFYAKNDGYITSSDGEDALFRVQTGVFHVKANAEAYLAEVEAAGIDAYITTQAIEEALVEPESYTLKQFIRDVQTAVGVAVDGVVGAETLGNVPTISRSVNSTYPAVVPVQKYLHALGYVQVGKADGIAGSGFERAVKTFQTDTDGQVDGEITAGGPAWRKLLGLDQIRCSLLFGEIEVPVADLFDPATGTFGPAGGMMPVRSAVSC